MNTPSVTVAAQGPYRLRRTVEEAAPTATRLVLDHMREYMPRTEIRLVTHAGMADAVPESIGVRTTGARRAWEMYQTRRLARASQGLTLPTHDGRVLVLLRIDAMRSAPDQLMPALVHELVHAVQMGRPGVADQALSRARHDLGAETMPRRWLREQGKAVERHEAEAYRIEDLLSSAAKAVA